MCSITESSFHTLENIRVSDFVHLQMMHQQELGDSSRQSKVPMRKTSKWGGAPAEGGWHLCAAHSTPFLFSSTAPRHSEFGIFGPLGNRVQRRVKLMVFALVPGGVPQPAVLTSPGSLADRKESFLVFSTTAIMFSQLGLATCEASGISRKGKVVREWFVAIVVSGRRQE